MRNIQYKGLRTQIAACTRIMNMNGLIDYSGHVSARLPGNVGILIQCFDDSRASLQPDRLLIVDMEGNLIDGPEKTATPREVFIHTNIMKVRPDIQAIGHFHPEIATMFTFVQNQRLVPVKNHAARWANGIPVHPDPGHVNSPKSGAALAVTLGNCHAALIRAHGAVLCAESVPALLTDSVHFEENAQMLYRASALGPVTSLSLQEMEAFLGNFNRDAHVKKLWKYFLLRAVDTGIVPDDWPAAIEDGD
ncbi:MAG: class II aldolase/adducin family protein [Pseudomonadota bacterium]|nr:class II aldolase/adducin family protein [Pseudomonadota bacterium]